MMPDSAQNGEVPNIYITPLMTKVSVLTLMIVLKGMMALEIDKELGGGV